MGDPSGIGPEVALKSLASPKVKGLADFFLIGDASVIGRLMKRTGLRLNARLLNMSNVPERAFEYGRIRPAFGKASVRYLDKAVELIARRDADALVTAPINKTSIRAAGFPGFEGHTEYLAALTGTKDFAMMFVGRSLKITLVTRHMALKYVPRSLSAVKIYNTIALTHKYLKKFFAISKPRIGVAGLNPHAGESGNFGDEEERIIRPAVKKASRKMGGIYGPIPPDIIFPLVQNGRYDAAVAMYHDQGLIPFKMFHFKDGVNLTLGLPFVRTSPDHGTAFDIAGKLRADPASMIEAIILACRLCRKTRLTGR